MRCGPNPTRLPVGEMRHREIVGVAGIETTYVGVRYAVIGVTRGLRQEEGNRPADAQTV
ncbi:hypothetical protein GS4_38_00460 [Gordonia soli NBRC 108243]|uniref:Uncharacterized protein n=1 Tax=Gordonia soli NBRC 108243 TaxID=1223545 RepID=M0QPM8_9ACTN|nr:hypothetical protein GS4_38_00460 [Gordonia soli NBRC 108243]